MHNQVQEVIQGLFYASLILTAGIVIRLFQLQIMNHDHYFRKSMGNYTRFETIDSMRGEILDCNGLKLATNRPVINLYWQGTGRKKLSSEQTNLLKGLSTYLSNAHFNEELIQEILKAERTKKRILIYSDVSVHELSQIEEMCSGININIQHDKRRYYPFQKTACHIIGYLRDSQQVAGTMGLEKYQGHVLQGKEGTRTTTINLLGKKITAQEAPAHLGTSIKTTIDINIQLLAEKVFHDAYKGTCIIMNPADGAIKALVSLPNYDPTIFLGSLGSNEWHELQEARPFLNKATQCAYPPGSLFKLITACAALEYAIIEPQSRFCCKGSFTCGNRTYYCNNRKGHGELSIMQGLARSCNIPFYMIGTQLPIDTLADYAHRFGLGLPTGFLMPEKSGLVPTASWKYKTKNERWWPGETVSAAIGQSYLLTTPLQITRMFAGIFTGYLVKPRIMEDEPVETKTLAIKPDTLQFLQQSMRAVVTQGTARLIGTSDKITVYAKTSTAQVASLHPNRKKEHLEHGWFACYFECENRPPLVLVILVEHAGSSRVPARIAKEFIVNYCAIS